MSCCAVLCCAAEAWYTPGSDMDDSLPPPANASLAATAATDPSTAAAPAAASNSHSDSNSAATVLHTAATAAAPGVDGAYTRHQQQQEEVLTPLAGARSGSSSSFNDHLDLPQPKLPTDVVAAAFAAAALASPSDSPIKPRATSRSIQQQQQGVRGRLSSSSGVGCIGSTAVPAAAAVRRESEESAAAGSAAAVAAGAAALARRLSIGDAPKQQQSLQQPQTEEHGGGAAATATAAVPAAEDAISKVPQPGHVSVQDMSGAASPAGCTSPFPSAATAAADGQVAAAALPPGVNSTTASQQQQQQQQQLSVAVGSNGGEVRAATPGPDTSRTDYTISSTGAEAGWASRSSSATPAAQADTETEAVGSAVGGGCVVVGRVGDKGDRVVGGKEQGSAGKVSVWGRVFRCCAAPSVRE